MLLILLGCTPASTVETSCTEDAGYEDPSPAAVRALDRANCARQVVGLPPGSLDPRVDQAAQAHADYMTSNGILDHQEIEGNPGFTGVWAWDRLESAGYPLLAGSAWSEVVAEGEQPVSAVELWLNSVYHRVPFTTPGWIAVGFGQAELYSSMSFVVSYPYGRRVALLYPADGQTGVPTTFNSDIEYPDPAPDQGNVGPPITVTVGEATMDGPDHNPHDLHLVSASLVGPDGELDLLTLEPEEDEWISFTVAAVPIAPLMPATEYEMEMVVFFGGEEETLSGTFTTE